MEDQFKNYELFKNIGLDEYHYWMLYDDSLKGLFKFCCGNVNELNILSELEVEEYAEMKKTGELLSDGEMEAELTKVDRSFPNIIKNTEDTVCKLEIKLEEYVMMEEKNENLLSDIEKTNRVLGKELLKLCSDLSQMEYVEQKQRTDCLNKAKLLNKKQENTNQLLNELNNCYHSEQTPSLFIHQMPLDKYFKRNEQFGNYIEIFIKNNFNVNNNLNKEYLTNFDDTVDKLLKLKDKLLLVENKIIHKKNEVNAVDQCFEKLGAQQLQMNSVKCIEKACDDLTNTCGRSLLKISALSENLEILLQEKVNQDVEVILHQNNKKKLERASNRLNNLKHIMEILSDVTNNAEVLWILLQLDLERVSQNIDSSENVTNSSTMCLTRMNLMKQLEKINGNIYGDMYLQDLTNLLSGYVKYSENPELMSIISEYDSLRKKAKKIIPNIINQQYYKSSDELLSKIVSTEKMLEKYVCNGPTSRPVLKNPKLFEPIQNARVNLEKINETNISLREQFRQNILGPMKNDNFYCFLQLLWIWFLTEPKKVISAINNIKKAASKTSSYKSIPGITCKKVEDK